MDIICSGALSFVLGFLSSWVFWRHLIHIRPSLELCREVARCQSEKYQGTELLKFKVVNKSNRNAVDVFAGCTVSYLRDVPGGKRSYVLERLNVVMPSFELIGPRKNLGDHFGLSPVKVFTVHVTDTMDANLARESARLVFTLKATDALSGSTTVIRHTYVAKSIRRGEFAYGLGAGIVEMRNNEPCTAGNA